MGIGCDLPAASGLSTSSALVCSIFLSVDAAQPQPLASRSEYKDNIFGVQGGLPLELYAYLGCIENGQSFRALAGDRGVGTFGGSEDHTAIMGCTRDALAVFGFCPTRFEQSVPFPASLRFVVAVSGVIAEKTSSAKERYNEAALRARYAAQALCVTFLADALDEMSRGASASGDSAAETRAAALEALRARIIMADDESMEEEAEMAEGQRGDTDSHDGRRPLALSSSSTGEAGEGSNVVTRRTRRPSRLVDRFDQFHFESSTVVPKLATCFQRIAAAEKGMCGDGAEEQGVAREERARILSEMGSLVDQSQEKSETLLGNIVQETSWLPAQARCLGAYAASAFGAGFGGSVWAVVEASEAEAFTGRWAESYADAFPDASPRSSFFTMRPGPAATRIHPLPVAPEKCGDCVI